MPKIRFSKEDLIKKTPLEAAWYLVNLKKVKEGPGKSDPNSTTYTLDFTLKGGKFNGVPVRHWFSEKMIENAAEFIKCFVVKAEEGKEYELEECIDRDVEAYISYDPEQHQNRIEEFRAVKRG